MTTQNLASRLPRTRRAAIRLSPPPARTRPAFTLPPLPTDATERAQALADLAGAIVGEYGAVIALALAASIDEAAAEVAGDAERR